MAKEYLPQNRQWTQRNDGTGTLSGTFGVDFEADRGKVRVSKPVLRLFDQNTDIDRYDDGFVTNNNGEKLDRVAQSFVTFDGDFYALANVPYYSGRAILGTSSDALDVDKWRAIESTNAPDSTGAGIVWNGKLMVIDNGISAGIIRAGATDNTWSTYWANGATINKTSGRIDFIHPAPDGNMYVLDEDNYVHRVKPNDTADFADASSPANQGTLDFSDRDIAFTCVNSNATRMFIGFSNNSNSRGGVIEWDLSANSVSANRVHDLSAAPRCLAVWDDLIIAVMSDGSFKYFNGSSFVDYEGVQLPKIEGKYDDDFIHPNGWDIIDNMPHFLIKGGKSIEGSNSYSRDIEANLNFPSAVYCLDPQVGLYPRFALTNNTGTQSGYGVPAVAEVGALKSIDKEFSAFFASFEVYTAENVDIAVIAYHDESNGNDSRGWILYNDIERTQTSKNIEMLHRVLKSGNVIKAYYQEYEEDDQIVDGVWGSTTEFHTTDTVDVDDKWLAWVKAGDGAGQFLRVDSVSGETTKVIKFKDTNTYANLNDFGVIQFVKFRYFGQADKTTTDFHTLAFPSGAKTRKVKVLYELTQAAGTVNELDYSIYES